MCIILNTYGLSKQTNPIICFDIVLNAFVIDINLLRISLADTRENQLFISVLQQTTRQKLERYSGKYACVPDNLTMGFAFPKMRSNSIISFIMYKYTNSPNTFTHF